MHFAMLRHLLGARCLGRNGYLLIPDHMCEDAVLKYEEVGA
jgi:hypothetical protein